MAPRTLLIPSLLDDWFPLLRHAFASDRWDPVLLTEAAVFPQRVVLPCIFDSGTGALSSWFRTVRPTPLRRAAGAGR